MKPAPFYIQTDNRMNHDDVTSNTYHKSLGKGRWIIHMIGSKVGERLTVNCFHMITWLSQNGWQYESKKGRWAEFGFQSRGINLIRCRTAKLLCKMGRLLCTCRDVFSSFRTQGTTALCKGTFIAFKSAMQNRPIATQSAQMYSAVSVQREPQALCKGTFRAYKSAIQNPSTKFIPCDHANVKMHWKSRVLQVVEPEFLWGVSLLGVFEIDWFKYRANFQDDSTFWRLRLTNILTYSLLYSKRYSNLKTLHDTIVRFFPSGFSVFHLVTLLRISLRTSCEGVTQQSTFLQWVCRQQS